LKLAGFGIQVGAVLVDPSSPKGYAEAGPPIRTRLDTRYSLVEGTTEDGQKRCHDLLIVSILTIAEIATLSDPSG